MKAEGHIPDLACKDHHDAGRLEPQLVVRRKGHEGQHDARHESQNGNRLQHVEHRNHHGLGPAIVRGDGAVNQREGQRQKISGEAAPRLSNVYLGRDQTERLIYVF